MRHPARHVSLLAVPAAVVCAVSLTRCSTAPSDSTGTSGTDIASTRYAPCTGNDDTKYIQGLLGHGGVVTLPAGTCIVSGTLEIGQTGTTLTGAGAQNTVSYAGPPSGSTPLGQPSYTIITANGNAYPGFPIVDITATNVTVSNLTVNGNANNQADTNGVRDSAINVELGATGAHIENVEVTNAAGIAILVQGSNGFVSANYVHDNFGIGIFVQGDQTSTYNGGSTPVYNHAKPEALARVDGVTVTRNIVSGSHLLGNKGGAVGDGLDIDKLTSRCIVDSNTVTDNDIILAHEDVDPNGNHYCDYASDGSLQCYSWGHQVTNNVVLRTQDNAISIKDHVDNVTVSGNFVRTFGTNAGGFENEVNGYGIKIGGPVGTDVAGSVNTFSNNTILGVPGVAPNGTCPALSSANYPGDQSKRGCGGIMVWATSDGAPENVTIANNGFPNGANGESSIDVLGGAVAVHIEDNSGTVNRRGESDINTSGLPALPANCVPSCAQPCTPCTSPAVAGADFATLIVSGNH